MDKEETFRWLGKELKPTIFVLANDVEIVDVRGMEKHVLQKGTAITIVGHYPIEGEEN